MTDRAAKDFFWENIRSLPYFRGMLRAIESRFMAGVDLEPPVLDVGCGDGHFASIAFAGPLDVGVDPWRKPLLEAQRYHAHRNLLQTDERRLPFRDGSFSSAVSNSVLEHVAALSDLLQEIARVLRSGAMFVFTVPNPGYRQELSIPTGLTKLGLSGLGRMYADWFMQMSKTYNLYDEAGWTELLRESGFQIERSQRYFSPEALRALEWGHYLGAPTLLPRWAAGRWILVPRRWNLALTERRIRKYYEEPPDDRGTYTYYLVRKT